MNPGQAKPSTTVIEPDAYGEYAPDVQTLIQRFPIAITQKIQTFEILNPKNTLLIPVRKYAKSTPLGKLCDPDFAQREGV